MMPPRSYGRLKYGRNSYDHWSVDDPWIPISVDPPVDVWIPIVPPADVWVPIIEPPAWN